ncbi:MAG: hypothetical protein PF484_13130 [Bacteroidales bacterium]|jgi:hypothetical protein|nr:hypothetical protein [Bacteroidales bacterium]
MEQKQALIVPEQIHLLVMEVVQQKIDALAFKKQKQHQLKVGHKLMHNLKEERVKMELAFSFEDESKKQLLFFQIDFHFQVDNLSNFYQLKQENQPVFYAPMIATLLGISLSTARGIIFEKLQNAGIKNVLIPVVSPQKMLIKPN